MSRGELFIVMTGGMAGIAGTMMVLYASILGDGAGSDGAHPVGVADYCAGGDRDRGADGAAPWARQQQARWLRRRRQKLHGRHYARTIDGLTLLLNIVAMLIVLVALVTVANLATLVAGFGGKPITLQSPLGALMEALV